ncbi:MAG TPA: hypothetical protein DHW40_02540 [Microbacterium sp.]|nr:hypothetical protein [Microbacterium sp.]
MPAADRFHASVRIDVDLTCAHPDELIDGLSDERRMGSAGLDGEEALLSLIDVVIAPGARHLARIEAVDASIVASEWRDGEGSVPAGTSDETRVAQAGSRLSGIDWALDELFAEGASPAEGARGLRQRSVLKGLIWNASVVIVDCLFEDIVSLATHGSDRSHWRDTHVISQLPPQFAKYYDRSFAQKFLAATIEVTSRLTASPVYPQTVAHELALKIVLDEAERNADRLAGSAPEGWREHLDAVLFQDLDIDSLYVPASPDDEDAASAVPPMDFASWFIPYSHATESVPYANDEAKEPAGR